MPKRYLVKYALGEGVKIVEGGPSPYNNGYFSPNGYMYSFKEGRDCVEDRDAAIARVIDMRDKKILALKRQIDKLLQIDPETLVTKAEEVRE